MESSPYLTADIGLPIGLSAYQINPVMPRGAAHSLPKLIHPREQETDPDPIKDSGDPIPLMLTVASMWMPMRASEVVCGPAAAIPPIFHRKMLRKESESRKSLSQAPLDQAPRSRVRPMSTG